jgi:hypothetical protein
MLSLQQMFYGQVQDVQGMVICNSILIIDIIQIKCLMQSPNLGHMEGIETLFSPKNNYQ